MELNLVVPTLRTGTVERLLRSLSLGTSRPDVVTLVSNEVGLDIETFGLDVQVARFRSATVPIGYGDLALRRNIGIWAAAAGNIVILDDDLVAAADLVSVSRELLRTRRYFWGHHRYLSFTDHSVEELVTLPSDRGRPREQPPNSWHLWMSCYGGMFGAAADLVRDLGGFDLVFSCRQASEDQQLGKRIAHHVDGTERMFIYEPPFAWHPTEPEPWDPPAFSNICPSGHETFDATVGKVPVQRCRRCPRAAPGCRSQMKRAYSTILSTGLTIPGRSKSRLRSCHNVTRRGAGVLVNNTGSWSDFGGLEGL